MKTKFIDNHLSNKYSTPVPILEFNQNIFKDGKQYTLLGRCEKSYKYKHRAWFGIRALTVTLFTLGIGLLFRKKTQSNWKSFWTGKKVVVVYTSASALKKIELSTPTLNLKSPSLTQTSIISKEADQMDKTNQVVDVTPQKLNTPSPPVKKITMISTLPSAQQGEIKNGYGEYLIYRMTSEGKKEAVTTLEYDKVFSTIEACRLLDKEEMCQDKHSYLQTNIQEVLGSDVRIAFIPHTLYELIYLKECIQEDIDNQKCSNAKNTGILGVFREDHEYKKYHMQSKQKLIIGAMKKGFWQQCMFEDQDYLNDFTQKGNYDYREKHLKTIAAKLNEIALNYFENCSTYAFSYHNFEEVNNKIISFIKEVHNPYSELHKKVQNITALSGKNQGIAKAFLEETIKENAKADIYPMGIANDYQEQIIKKAMQLECSAEAIDSFILYRGGIFEKDKLTKESYKTESGLQNPLPYGSGLYSGALFDGEETPFHHMRKEHFNAQAVIVSMKKQKSGKTPFHIPNVHTLIQLMSRGTIYQARTKYWKMNSTDTAISPIEGEVNFSILPDCFKSTETQEKMEKKFLKYKCKTFNLDSEAK